MQKSQLVTIGVTRNELGIVLGYGNVGCGSFLLHRCGRKFCIPLERGSLKSVTDFDEDQLQLATGERYRRSAGKNEPLTWSMPNDWVDIAIARSQQVVKILEDTPIIEDR